MLLASVFFYGMRKALCATSRNWINFNFLYVIKII